jgi:hypothetical protein
MGAIINTNRSVVIRLQQIMCSQKIYGGVVIRQLQIMCSNNMSEMPFVALESVLLIFFISPPKSPLKSPPYTYSLS